MEDELDDMAFLDAQIEAVQNSHGRRVDGKGNYKSIVNGILLSKPSSQCREASKKTTKASAALQAKLQQSQEGRKAKPKKKKR
jgi:hypothetical protein